MPRLDHIGKSDWNEIYWHDTNPADFLQSSGQEKVWKHFSIEDTLNMDIKKDFEWSERV